MCVEGFFKCLGSRIMSEGAPDMRMCTQIVGSGVNTLCTLRACVSCVCVRACMYPCVCAAHVCAHGCSTSQQA